MEDANEQFAQQQQLIEQLKQMVRDKDQEIKTSNNSLEQRLKVKEKELQDAATKLSHIKLQNKAKNVSNQQKKQQPIKPKEEIKSESPSPQKNPDSSSRGKMVLLKKKLDENRQKFEKREKEMLESQKGIEETVNSLKKQLEERDAVIEELKIPKQSDVVDSPEKLEMNSEELYAQILYKDNKIYDLNNEILELERKIIDVQETVKEKDEVIQARNKAITLITEDLSKKGKTVVDDLDMTRDQMREMQNNFVAKESEWKSERNQLVNALDRFENKSKGDEDKIAELQRSIENLEATRFQLATSNAELQEKCVLAQESVLKQVSTYKDEIEKIKSLLVEKQAENEDQVAKLKDEHDKEILWLKGENRTLNKSFDLKINELNQSHESEINVLKARLDESVDSNDTQKRDIEDLNRQIEAGKEELNAQMEVIETLQKNLSSQEESRKKTIEKFNVQIEDMEKAYAEIQGEKEQMEKCLEKSEKELENLKVKAENDIDELNEQIRCLTEKDSQLEELKLNVSQYEQKNEELAQELESSKGNAQQLENILREKNDELEKMQMEFSTFRQAMSDDQSSMGVQINELTENLRVVHEHLEQQKELTTQAEQRLQELATEKMELEQIKRENTKQVESLQVAVTSARAEIDMLEQNDTQKNDVLDSVKAELGDLKSSVSYLENEILKKDDLIGLMSSEKKQAEEDIRSVNVANEQLKRLLDEAEMERQNLVAVVNSENEQKMAADNQIADLAHKLSDMEESHKNLTELIKMKEAEYSALLESTLANDNKTQELNAEIDRLKHSESQLAEEKATLANQNAELHLCLSEAQHNKEQITQEMGAVTGTVQDLRMKIEISEKMKDELEQEIENLSAQKDEAASAFSLLSEKVNELEESNKNLSETLQMRDENLSSLQEYFNVSKSENQNLLIQVERLQFFENEYKNVTNQLNDADQQASAQNAELSNQNTALKQKVHDVEKEVLTLKNHAEDLRIQNESLGKEVGSRDGVISQLQAELASSEEEIKQVASDYREQINAYEDKVQELGSQVADLQSRHEEASVISSDSQLEVRELQKTIASFQNELQNRDNIIEQLESLKQQSDQEREVLRKRVEELMKMQSDGSDLKEQLGMYQQRALELEHALSSSNNQIQLLENSVKDHQKEALYLNQQLKNQSDEGLELRNLSSNLQQQMAKDQHTIDELKNTITELESSKCNNETEISNLKSQLDEVSTLQQQMALCQQRILELEAENSSRTVDDDARMKNLVHDLRCCEDALDRANRDLHEERGLKRELLDELEELRGLVHTERDGADEMREALQVAKSELQKQQAEFKNLESDLLKQLEGRDSEILNLKEEAEKARNGGESKDGWECDIVEPQIGRSVERELAQGAAPMSEGSAIVLKELQSKFDNLNKEHQKLKIRNDKMLAKLKAFKDKNDKLQSSKATVDKENMDLNNQIEEMKVENNQIQSQLDDINKGKSMMSGSIEKQAAKIAEIGVANHNLQQEKVDAQNEVERLIIKLRKVEKKSLMNEEEMDNLRGELEKLHVENSRLKPACDGLNNELQEAHNMHRLKCDEVSKLAMELQAERNNFAEMKEKVLEEQLKIANLQEQHQQSQLEMQSLNVENGRLQSELAIQIQNNKKLNDIKTKHDLIEQQLSQVKADLHTSQAQRDEAFDRLGNFEASWTEDEGHMDIEMNQLKVQVQQLQADNNQLKNANHQLNQDLHLLQQAQEAEKEIIKPTKDHVQTETSENNAIEQAEEELHIKSEELNEKLKKYEADNDDLKNRRHDLEAWYEETTKQFNESKINQERMAGQISAMHDKNQDLESMNVKLRDEIGAMNRKCNELRQRSSQKESSELIDLTIERLRAELHRAMESLHHKDRICEEMKDTIAQLQEEKYEYIAKQKLSRSNLEEDVHSLASSPNSSTVVDMDDIPIDSQPADSPMQLHQPSLSFIDDSQLEEMRNQLLLSERDKVDLQNENTALNDALSMEQQRRHDIEMELKCVKQVANLDFTSPSKSDYHLNFEDEAPLLYPETEHNLTLRSTARTVQSHSYKLRRWLKGRQLFARRIIKTKSWLHLSYYVYFFAIHILLLSCYIL